MTNITLIWKNNNINLNLLNKKVKEINASYCGCTADKELTLYFDVESLTEEQLTTINEYWNSLDEESEEVKTYKSLEDELLEKAAKKESAKQKLLTLGFSEDEISALIGA